MLLLMMTSFPKRSACLAAKIKLRAPKSEAQETKPVLMKKLGLPVETAKSDEASLKKFQQTFTTPLQWRSYRVWPRAQYIRYMYTRIFVKQIKNCPENVQRRKDAAQAAL